MVTKSKNKASKAQNPYKQPVSKVKKKESKTKISSDNLESVNPVQKNEASDKTENNDDLASSSKKEQVEIDSNNKDMKTDEEAKDNKNGEENKEENVNKDKESKAKQTIEDTNKPEKVTNPDSKKEESSTTGKTKAHSKQDSVTPTSKRSKTFKPDVKKEDNLKSAKQKEEKEMSLKEAESKVTATSEKENKPTESEANKTEESDSEEESDSDDSEEEESDEEEDPLIAQLASKYNLKVDEPDSSLPHVVSMFTPECSEEPQEAEEAERLLTAKSNVVNLSALSLRYNSKNKSALQPILVDYGLPDPYAGHQYVKEKKKKKKRVQNQQDERDVEKEEQLKERHEQVYNDIHRMREYLQEDYLDKLQDRVAKQRKDIKKKSEELEMKLLKMEQKKKDSLKYEKKLQRHELTHDVSHLQAVPKSNAYKMVSWENKLKNMNKLKTQEDMDNFWSCVDDDFALKDYLKRQGLGASKPKDPAPSHLEDSFSSSRTSSMSSITQEKEHTMEFQRTLTQIEEMKEPSRPSTREANGPWAVTQLATHKHSRRTRSPTKGSRSVSPMKTILSVSSSPSRKPQDPHTIAKQAAAELDRKHPMKELPPMNCFSVNMDESATDPDEVLKELRHNRREKERTLFVKRIRSMYQRSKANVASTQRIMDKRYDDFTLDDEAPPTDTWLSSYDLEPKAPQRLEPIHPDIQYINARPWLKHVRHRAIVTIVEESEPPSGVQSQETSASLVRQRPSGRDVYPLPSSIHSHKPSSVPALSMDTVEHSSKVLEAQCLSTMWTNYLGVGKSVFAH